MKNCTLLLLCIGVLIVVAFADEVENESIEEVDSELEEDILFRRCVKEGKNCSKNRRCCRRMKCDDETKKCVKEPCKIEGEACRRNRNCCTGMKCCRKQKKCVKRAETTPEDFMENIELDEELDEIDN